MMLFIPLNAELVVWRTSRQRPSPAVMYPQPASAEGEDKMKISSEQKADIVRRIQGAIAPGCDGIAHVGVKAWGAWSFG